MPDEGTRDLPWKVAPGVFGLGPHGRTQTMVYLVKSGASWVLVDTGWSSDGRRIIAAAEALFGAETPPVAILLTHAHPDHAGSAGELAERWGATVYVHPAELAIASGDFAAMRASAGPIDRWLVLPMMRAIGRRRREALIAKSSLAGVVRPLEPGDGVPGLPDWVRVPTPGHTPGHLSLFRPADRVAITGDALVTMRLNSLPGLLLGRSGLSGPPRYTSWDWSRAMASIAVIGQLEPRVVAGGHGTPLTGEHTPIALAAFLRG
jgi:glyoxylase-like metal-dependent hydrolase (beta-lactamase superfamily II)